MNQAVAQALLEHLGVAVIMASNGEEALRHFSAPPEGVRFDLVLMDCQMPRLDGLASTRRLRAIEAERGLPRTPGVAMTANSPAEAGEECAAAGMDDFLAKPVVLEQLREVLARWMP